MIIAGEKANRFNVEICLPRERKLLGIFGGVKFHEFREIASRQVEELIRSFFQESLVARHASVEAARR